MTRTQRYTIEIWVPLDSQWKPVLSAVMPRDTAEKRLRFETTSRRGRLVDGKGKIVLHSGIVEEANHGNVAQSLA